MLNLGWGEVLVVVVVALVVVGPKDLPRLLGSWGRYARKMRRMASDFQRQFEDAINESEFTDVKTRLQSMRERVGAIDLTDSPILLPPSAELVAKDKRISKPGAEQAEPRRRKKGRAAPAKRKSRAPKTAPSTQEN